MMVYVSIVNQVTKTGSGRNLAIVLKKGRFLAPGCETEKALYEQCVEPLVRGLARRLQLLLDVAAQREPGAACGVPAM